MQRVPPSSVDVTVGTLSKAFGCLGGFAAVNAQLRSLLLNRGRNVIFSTSLPLPVVAAARAALRVSQRCGRQRPERGVLRARCCTCLRSCCHELRSVNCSPARITLPLQHDAPLCNFTHPRESWRRHYLWALVSQLPSRLGVPPWHCLRGSLIPHPVFYTHRESWRRRHLLALVSRLSSRLGVPAHSPVIPLVVGEC